MPEVLEWLEATTIGLLVRESLWGFQIVVAMHILGIALSVGTLIWLDLRLLGVAMDDTPVATVYRQVMPWAFVGFVIMFATGMALATGFATRAYVNLFFRLKLAALVLAGINAAVYHLGVERRIADWNVDRLPPLRARAAGLISITLWALVILAGRMMAYTMY